ncbi:MAG: hypothetical protein K9N55_10345 [Phycisphaerae bacterium]|nr:hypothetical protein [Phycisphaerae bacterium]
MTAILRAITWEFWRENRWWIILSVSAILGLTGLVYNEPLPAYDSEDQISHFTTLILEMWSFAMFLWIGQYNKVKGRLGFPEHLFIKPVRMRSVASIRLGLAVITAVSLYLLTAGAFYWATGMRWPIALPCLFMTICIVFVHAMVWSLPAEPALQILFSAIGYIVLCLQYHENLHSQDSSKALGLICLTALWTGLAIAGAALDRRSQRIKLTTLWNQILMACIAFLPWKDCTNASPQRALFWFHWIKKGWIMPALSVILMILGYVLIWAVPRTWTDPADFIMAYFSFVFLFHIVGFPLLVSLITCQQETHNQGLPTYTSSLPVSNRDMLLAYLKASLASLFMSWGIFVIGICLLQLLLTIAGKGHYTQEFFSNIENLTGFFRTQVFENGNPKPKWLLQTPGMCILIAWAALGLVGSMLLTGRRSVSVTTLIILSAWPILPALAEAFDAPQPVFVAIYTLEACLFILGIIGGTIAAYVFGLRKKCIPPYVAVAALGLSIVLNLIYGQFIWRSTGEILGSLALLAVVTLPLAPFATAPLALAWNRHR